MTPKPVTPTTRKNVIINTFTNILTGRFSDHAINHALEHAMCSCKPLRDRRRELIKAHKKRIGPRLKQVSEERERLEKRVRELWTEQQKLEANPEEVNELSKQIQRIDVKEHPKAERKTDFARQWARVWVIDQMNKGTTLPTDPDKLRAMYAEAIAKGWQPTVTGS